MPLLELVSEEGHVPFASPRPVGLQVPRRGYLGLAASQLRPGHFWLRGRDITKHPPFECVVMFNASFRRGVGVTDISQINTILMVP